MAPTCEHHCGHSIDAFEPVTLMRETGGCSWRGAAISSMHIRLAGVSGCADTPAGEANLSDYEACDLRDHRGAIVPGG